MARQHRQVPLYANLYQPIVSGSEILTPRPQSIRPAKFAALQISHSKLGVIDAVNFNEDLALCACQVQVRFAPPQKSEGMETAKFASVVFAARRVVLSVKFLPQFTVKVYKDFQLYDCVSTLWAAQEKILHGKISNIFDSLKNISCKGYGWRIIYLDDLNKVCRSDACLRGSSTLTSTETFPCQSRFGVNCRTRAPHCTSPKTHATALKIRFHHLLLWLSLPLPQTDYRTAVPMRQTVT